MGSSMEQHLLCALGVLAFGIPIKYLSGAQSNFLANADSKLNLKTMLFNKCACDFIANATLPLNKEI